MGRAGNALGGLVVQQITKLSVDLVASVPEFTLEVLLWGLRRLALSLFELDQSLFLLLGGVGRLKS